MDLKKVCRDREETYKELSFMKRKEKDISINISSMNDELGNHQKSIGMDCDDLKLHIGIIRGLCIDAEMMQISWDDNFCNTILAENAHTWGFWCIASSYTLVVSSI